MNILKLQGRRTWPDVVPPENRTLGWHILEWCTKYLLQPDGPNAGQPFEFTGEQTRIVLRMYEIDSDGFFKRPKKALRRMKGWGKDPFAAALACVEFCGPCRFGGWDRQNYPIVVPHPMPWIQIAAVSEQQTTNTMSLLPAMMSQAMISKYGIKTPIGKTIVWRNSGARIQACTSSPKSLEGGRPTFAIKNETQNWDESNSGHEMSEVIDRNINKSRDGLAHSLEICNAHQLGANSVHEKTAEAFEKIVATGVVDASGYYFDSTEGDPAIRLENIDDLRQQLEFCRGDSLWLNIDNLIRSILDPASSVDNSLRFYLNIAAADIDAWTTATEYDGCGVGERIGKLDEVVFGFDGGKSEDATALVVVRVKDGLADCIRIWEKPEINGAGWTINHDEVDRVIAKAFKNYNCIGFYADVRYWESNVNEWSQKYGKFLKIRASEKSRVGWDMSTRLKIRTANDMILNSAITQGIFKHTGHLDMRRHVLNARRALNQYGVSFRKKSRNSDAKVDALAALSLAHMARNDYLEKTQQKQKGRMVLQ